MEIKAFKLISGEEIIARVEGETNTVFKLTRPMLVHISAGHDGSPQIGLMPYVISNQDVDVILSKHAISVEIGSINVVLEKKYTEVTSPINLI